MNAGPTLLGIVSAAENGSLKIFELDNGELWTIHQVTRGKLNHMAVSWDGCQAVLAMDEGTLPHWDLETGEPIGPLPAGAGRILGLEAGTLPAWVWATEQGLASCTPQASPRWDFEFSGPDAVEQFAFSPGGRFAVWITREGILHLWDGQQRELQRPRWQETVSEPISCLAVTPAGDRIVCGHQRTLAIYSLENSFAGEPQLQLLASQKIPGGVGLLAISRDGRRLLAGNAMGMMSLWNPDAGEQLRHWFSSNPQCLALTPDGSYALVGHLGGRVEVRDLESGKVLRTIATQQGKLVAVCARPLPARLAKFKSSPAFRLLEDLTALRPRELDHLMIQTGVPPRRTRSTKRPHRNRCIDFLDWAQSPDGCGLEDVQERLKRLDAAKSKGSFRSAPPMKAPGDSEVPPPEEPPFLYRNTDVEFRRKVELGKRYPLRIQFVMAAEEKAHPHDQTLRIAVPPAPPGQTRPPIEIRIDVFAPRFQIEGESSALVIVPLDGPSQPVVFQLIGEEPGESRLTVDFHQKGQYLGSVHVKTEITAAAELANSNPPAERPTRHSLALEDPALQIPAADLRITVCEHTHNSPYGTLLFSVDSEHEGLQDLEVASGNMGFQVLRKDLNEWVEGRLESLSDLARKATLTAEECERQLTAIGNRFFDELLPKELQRLALELAESDRGVETLAILSDEPHIPWELIKPYRKGLDEQFPFWGEQYQITRWLRGRPGPRVFPLDRAYALMTEGVTSPRSSSAMPAEALAPSHQSPNEWDGLQTLVQKRGGQSVSILEAYRHLLENTFRVGFDWLHVGTHGIFTLEDVDRSALAMNDGLFCVEDLRADMDQSESRPFVFLNACRSGRMGYSLTRLSSWGARLTQELGCGGFLGSLWDVTQQGAEMFACEFYKALDEGASLGKATWKARTAVRKHYPDDPSWLAFCCFVHPAAQLANPQKS